MHLIYYLGVANTFIVMDNQVTCLRAFFVLLNTVVLLAPNTNVMSV